MLKICCSVLFTIMTCCQLHAQEADTAVVWVRYGYSYVMDTTQPDNPFKDDMVLLIGKNMSSYVSYNAMQQRKKFNENAKKNTGITVVGESGGPGGVRNDKAAGVGQGVPFEAKLMAVDACFKNMSAATFSFIAFGGTEIFSVDEKIPTIKWDIKKETKEIHGLLCQKATGDYKGRNYVAWFCSQLPYSNGPWKLGGLPGLILEACDAKKEVVFTFESFENISSEKLLIAIPPFAIKTTPKAYRQYEQALAKNGGSVLPPGIMKLDGSRNGDGKMVNERKKNNPIEKVP